MTPSGWVLAVDFGTTNTAAAVMTPDGHVEVVRLSPQGDQMPSCVFDDDGRLLVGEVAASEAETAPQCFERSPKRRLGEPSLLLGEREWTTVDLVAAVLRHVLDKTLRVTGRAMPVRAVLTHPDGWGEQRLGRLREAAVLAGLPPVEMVPEPVAAARWYLERGELGPGAPVAVFDFGGGTCDVAVLRPDPAAPGSFLIQASAGEDGLGGDHIDDRLVDWVFDQLRSNGRGAMVDVLEDPDEEWGLALREQVRGAKHALSEHRSARIRVRSNGEAATLLITVDEFDRLIAGDVDRAIALTQGVLDHARPTTGTIAALFCTGGSTHIPFVQGRLTELTGRPPATLDDPKLVVAQGAALTAPAGGVIRNGGGTDDGDSGDGGEDGGTDEGKTDHRLRTRLLLAVGLVIAASLILIGVFTLTPTRAMTAPSDVEATPEDDGDVSLTWRRATDATQYEVYRDDRLLVTTEETSYVDSKASAGFEYHYSVVAVDGDDRSAGVTAPPVVPPLEPPESLTATPQGTNVLLEWGVVIGAERYEIRRDGDVLVPDVNPEYYLDEDVPAGDHRYEVTAVDEDAEGNTASESVSLFAPGEWQEAYRIPQVFPDLVSKEPEGQSWDGSVCRRGDPGGTNIYIYAEVECSYANGVFVEIWQFSDATDLAARLDEVGRPNPDVWNEDGQAMGDFYSTDYPWLLITFDDAERGLFCVYAHWEGRTFQELYDSWFLTAPI